MKKTKALNICIIAVMLLLIICPMTFGANTTTIKFKDKLFAEKVQQYIESLHPNQSVSQLNGTDMTIDTEILNNTERIRVGDGQEELDIYDLTGIEKFTNLKELYVVDTKITNIDPILELKNIENVNLGKSKKLGNKVLDIKKLTNLKYLSITDTNYTSLNGIEQLTNLETLYIGGDKVVDYSPLLKLTNIKRLYISSPMETLDYLKNMTKMEYLDVQGCEVKDISALSNMKNLKEFRGDRNHIESIENLSFNNKLIDFWVQGQTIKKFVKLSDKTGSEVTLDLPQLLTAAVTNGSLIYDQRATLEAKNGTVSSDNKKVTAKISDVKAGTVTVQVANSGQNAKESVVTYYEALEVLNVKKEPETENADKVKVTITVNKELDPNKVPQGWTLSNDKKSISKEFNKNGKEDVTLTDKDGSIATQNIEVSNIKNESEKPNPDLGKLEVTKKEEEQKDGKVKVTLTANKELDPNKIPEGWKLSEDGKSISKVMDKGAEEKITLVAKDGTNLDYTVKVGGKDEATEGFKVTGTDNEKQDNGKVKVTIKVNKELDPNKIPEGWKLSDDGKSIWKIMDQGKEEKVTLVAKDGSTIEYTVKAKTYDTDDKKNNTQAPTDLPQTGVRNVAIGVVAVVAIVGTVVFVRQKNMLK